MLLFPDLLDVINRDKNGGASLCNGCLSYSEMEAVIWMGIFKLLRMSRICLTRSVPCASVPRDQNLMLCNNAWVELSGCKPVFCPMCDSAICELRVVFYCSKNSVSITILVTWNRYLTVHRIHQ